MPDASQMYALFAAAYVRGEALDARENGGRIRSMDPEINAKPLFLPDELLTPSLSSLDGKALARIIDAGHAAGLKLYRFKNTHDLLPRVKSVLGFLRGVPFESLLDVGSGRGVFLWPFLNAFPWARVTSVDLLDYRVDFLQKTARGGLTQLSAVSGDLCRLPLPAESFDVVTLLEVLEHIPDTESALANAVRAARKCVVISVPNKPDDNPEHIHLFTKESLSEKLHHLGCNRLHFDGVNGHMIVYVLLKDHA